MPNESVEQLLNEYRIRDDYRQEKRSWERSMLAGTFLQESANPGMLPGMYFEEDQLNGGRNVPIQQGASKFTQTGLEQLQNMKLPFGMSFNSGMLQNEIQNQRINSGQRFAEEVERVWAESRGMLPFEWLYQQDPDDLLLLGGEYADLAEDVYNAQMATAQFKAHLEAVKIETDRRYQSTLGGLGIGGEIVKKFYKLDEPGRVAVLEESKDIPGGMGEMLPKVMEHWAEKTEGELVSSPVFSLLSSMDDASDFAKKNFIYDTIYEQVKSQYNGTFWEHYETEIELAIDRAYDIYITLGHGEDRAGLPGFESPVYDKDSITRQEFNEKYAKELRNLFISDLNSGELKTFKVFEDPHVRDNLWKLTSPGGADAWEVLGTGIAGGIGWGFSAFGWVSKHTGGSGNTPISERQLAMDADQQDVIRGLRAQAAMDDSALLSQAAQVPIQAAWEQLKKNNPTEAKMYIDMGGGDENAGFGIFFSAVRDMPEVEQELAPLAKDIREQSEMILEEISDQNFSATQATMALLAAYGRNVPMRIATFVSLIAYDGESRSNFLRLKWGEVMEEVERRDFQPSAVFGLEGSVAGLAIDLGLGIAFDPLTWLLGPAGKALSGRHMTVRGVDAAIKSSYGGTKIREMVQFLRSPVKDAQAVAHVLSNLDDVGALPAMYEAVGVVRPATMGKSPWMQQKGWTGKVDYVETESLVHMLDPIQRVTHDTWVAEAATQPFVRPLQAQIKSTGMNTPIIVEYRILDGTVAILSGEKQLAAAVALGGDAAQLPVTVRIAEAASSKLPGRVLEGLNSAESGLSATSLEKIRQVASAAPKHQGVYVTPRMIFSDFTMFGPVNMDAVREVAKKAMLRGADLMGAPRTLMARESGDIMYRMMDHMGGPGAWIQDYMSQRSMATAFKLVGREAHSELTDVTIQLFAKDPDKAVQHLDTFTRIRMEQHYASRKMDAEFYRLQQERKVIEELEASLGGWEDMLSGTRAQMPQSGGWVSTLDDIPDRALLPSGRTMEQQTAYEASLAAELELLPKPSNLVVMNMPKGISGGQIGADSAWLRWFRRRGGRTGGHMPQGYMQQGRATYLDIKKFADEHGMSEARFAGYEYRTKLNVDNADATIVFMPAGLWKVGKRKWLSPENKAPKLKNVKRGGESMRYAKDLPEPTSVGSSRTIGYAQSRGGPKWQDAQTELLGDPVAPGIYIDMGGRRPVLVIATSTVDDEGIMAIRRFLTENNFKALNGAGPGQSFPGVETVVDDVLDRVFGHTQTINPVLLQREAARLETLANARIARIQQIQKVQDAPLRVVKPKASNPVRAIEKQIKDVEDALRVASVKRQSLLDAPPPLDTLDKATAERLAVLDTEIRTAENYLSGDVRRTGFARGGFAKANEDVVNETIARLAKAIEEREALLAGATTTATHEAVELLALEVRSLTARHMALEQQKKAVKAQMRNAEDDFAAMQKKTAYESERLTEELRDINAERRILQSRLDAVDPAGRPVDIHAATEEASAAAAAQSVVEPAALGEPLHIQARGKFDIDQAREFTDTTGMATVINRRPLLRNMEARTKIDIYIGRPHMGWPDTGRWGNPYAVGAMRDPFTGAAFPQKLRRGEAAVKHKEHLRTQPDDVLDIIEEMRGRVLGCWCAPELCHGHTYMDLANGVPFEQALGGPVAGIREALEARLAIRPEILSNPVIAKLADELGLSVRGQRLPAASQPPAEAGAAGAATVPGEPLVSPTSAAEVEVMHRIELMTYPVFADKLVRILKSTTAGGEENALLSFMLEEFRKRMMPGRKATMTKALEHALGTSDLANTIKTADIVKMVSERQSAVMATKPKYGPPTPRSFAVSPVDPAARAALAETARTSLPVYKIGAEVKDAAGKPILSKQGLPEQFFDDQGRVLTEMEYRAMAEGRFSQSPMAGGPRSEISEGLSASEAARLWEEASNARRLGKDPWVDGPMGAREQSLAEQIVDRPGVNVQSSQIGRRMPDTRDLTFSRYMDDGTLGGVFVNTPAIADDFRSKLPYWRGRTAASGSAHAQRVLYAVDLSADDLYRWFLANGGEQVYQDFMLLREQARLRLFGQKSTNVRPNSPAAIQQDTAALEAVFSEMGMPFGRNGVYADPMHRMRAELRQAEYNYASTMNTAKKMRQKWDADSARLDAERRAIPDNSAMVQALQDMWDDFNREFIATNPAWKEFVDPDTKMVPWDILERGLLRPPEAAGKLEGAGRFWDSARLDAIKLNHKSVKDPDAYLRAFNPIQGGKAPLMWHPPITPLQAMIATKWGGATYTKATHHTLVATIRDLSWDYMRFWAVDKVFRLSTAVAVSMDELMRIWHLYGMEAVFQWNRDRLYYAEARARSVFQAHKLPNWKYGVEYMSDAGKARINRLQHVSHSLKQAEREMFEGMGFGWTDILAKDSDYLLAAQEWTGQILQDSGFRAMLRGPDDFKEFWDTVDAGHMQRSFIHRPGEKGGMSTQWTGWEEAYQAQQNILEFVLTTVNPSKKTMVVNAIKDTAGRIDDVSGAVIQEMPVEALMALNRVRGVKRMPVAGGTRRVARMTDKFFDKTFMDPVNYRRGFLAELARKYERERLLALYSDQGYKVIPDLQLAEQLEMRGIRGSSLEYLREHLTERALQEGLVPESHIAQLAEARARSEIQHTLFTWNQGSRMGAQGRLIIPFGRPWADMYGFWSRELLKKPIMRGWANDNFYHSWMGRGARSFVQNLPFNPRPMATWSRLAATDFNIDRGWVGEGGGILPFMDESSSNLGRMLFQPTKGDNPFFSILPGLGPVPLIFLDWALEQIKDPMDDPIGYQNLVNGIAEFLPPIGMRQGGSVSRALGGGTTEAAGMVLADALTVMTGRDFSSTVEEWGDISRTIERTRSVNALMSDPGVLADLLKMEDHDQVEVYLEALGFDADFSEEKLLDKTKESDRNAASVNMKRVVSNWFTPASHVFDTNIDQMENVWIAASEKFPVLGVRPDLRGSDPTDGGVRRQWADDIRRSFYKLTSNEQDALITAFPAMAVNLISMWQWSDSAKDTFSEAAYPYRIGGDPESLARHEELVRREYVKPRSPDERIQLILGRIRDAQVSSHKAVYEEMATYVNTTRWNNFVSDETKQLLETMMNYRNGEWAWATGVNDIEQLWKRWGTMEHLFELHLSETMNLETQEELEWIQRVVSIPGNQKAWSSKFPGLDELDLRDDFDSVVFSGKLPPQVEYLAGILGLDEIKKGVSGADIYRIIQDKIVNSNAPAFQYVRPAYDVYARARGSQNTAWHATLAEQVHNRTLNPEWRQELSSFLTWDAEQQDYWQDVVDGIPSDIQTQARERFGMLAHTAPFDMLWDEIWNSSFQRMYGTLDWTPPKPPPLWGSGPGGLSKDAYSPINPQVIDGDTLEVSFKEGDVKVHRVRLLGVRARDFGLDDEGAIEDKQRLTDILFEAAERGEFVYLVRDRRFGLADAYGRELAWLFIGDQAWYFPEDFRAHQDPSGGDE